MTEPLIDRNGLVGVIFQVMSDSGGSMTSGMTADAVLAYLRTVLTPEALDPREEWHGKMGELSRGWSDGTDLHRRIFGEDG